MTSLILESDGASWHASVDTWSISRESITMAMVYEDGYNGHISTVDVTPEGRSLEGYHSRYVSIDLNDLRIDERTSALMGRIGSEGRTVFISEATNDVAMKTVKPGESFVYTFTYSEAWPSLLSSQRSTAYVGSGLNDIEHVENNGDSVRRTSLYNSEFLKDSFSRAYLNRTNISVNAVDKKLGGVQSVQFMPTNYLVYKTSGRSSGITQTEYRQTDAYTKAVTAEGVSRFVGRFDTSTALNMNITNTETDAQDGWIQCCPLGCPTGCPVVYPTGCSMGPCGSPDIDEIFGS